MYNVGDFRTQVADTAQALGISPQELLTIMSYETGGSMDPLQAGPTTRHGQHRGYIQFGQPQAQAAGVTFDDYASSAQSQLGADGGIVDYLLDAGFQPGEHGWENAYAAINAGDPDAFGASDLAAGGDPRNRTVADKIAAMQGGHMDRANAIWSALDPYAGPQMTSDMARAGESPMEYPDVETFLSQFESGFGGGGAGGGGMVARQQPTDFWAMMGQMPELEGLNRRQEVAATMMDVGNMLQNFGRPVDPYGARNALEKRVLGEQSRNQTADVLDQMGRPGLANLVRSGQMGASEAVKIAYGGGSEGTALMQNLEYLMNTQGLSYEEAMETLRASSGGTSITVGDQASEYGTIPQGYQVIPDPDAPGGRRMIPIEGSEAAQARDDTAAAAAKARDADLAKSTREIGLVNDIRDAIRSGPVFGVSGKMAGAVPGSARANVMANLETLKANISFDAMQKLRDQSPTGSTGLGPISAPEFEALRASLVSLSLDQSEEQFLRNLATFEKELMNVIHGPPEHRNKGATSTGGAVPLPEGFIED